MFAASFTFSQDERHSVGVGESKWKHGNAATEAEYLIEKTCLNMSSGKKISMNSMAEVNFFWGFERQFFYLKDSLSVILIDSVLSIATTIVIAYF